MATNKREKKVKVYLKFPAGRGVVYEGEDYFDVIPACDRAFAASLIRAGHGSLEPVKQREAKKSSKDEKDTKGY